MIRKSIDKNIPVMPVAPQKAFLHSEHGLLSGSRTLLSISWEHQTHIPIMTSVGREEEKDGRKGGGAEGRIDIAQRLSIHQRKVQQKKRKKGEKPPRLT